MKITPAVSAVVAVTAAKASHNRPTAYELAARRRGAYTDAEAIAATAHFPRPALGSNHADPAKAAEFKARMLATHGPGGTQNPDLEVSWLEIVPVNVQAPRLSGLAPTNGARREPEFEIRRFTL